ncbi:UDP-N-acetylmuramoyl-L-alanyl-D-glutamate--2,6-diaminopimelate ligase [Drancourtella sp. An210]|nr:UDP-N-acetylmuramoyl-L-alanyl-D-glutamate--2,6-diaminopimelate ligase [Drancourtella sp. An210]OUP64406.1 UDP-N-acetylmuramoyl-L-alanyl-D-glutamate--2,6-diaminopimelate ligase [Drancourtella sp. An177]
MKLSGLLHTIAYERLEGTKEIPNTEVTGVFSNSRDVIPGSIFVCIRGSVCDGITYGREAIEKGAALVAAPKEQKEELKAILKAGNECAGILVEDEREALSVLAAAYEGYPAESLVMIGVTGTKGKTTTAYMIRHILEDAGYRVGLLGTIEQFDGEKSIPSVHTTPDAVCLHRELGRMRENGCDICVMEVSSQALKLERTYGIMFDIGIFLNLGKDHISRFEHSDEAEYLECKRKLFLQSDFGVGNRDDKRYDAVFRDTPCRKITYGIRSGRFRAENIFTDTWVDGRPGVIFTQDKTEYAIPVPGEYTVYNALAAIAVCRMMGVDKEKIRKTLRQFSVKGRAEFIKIPGGAVAVIDYAHNAMSLKSFLDTMRKYRPHRLITVFGCGGGRAKDRRYEMGRVSGLLSDLTVITSDNPRWENPEDIMEDIEEGIRETKGDYIKIPDRRKAVDFAVGMAREGDIIVVAGKGHETYQEIQGIKYEMDERRLVEEACMHRSS